MAGRKPKIGIDYAGWDVDVFSDHRVQDLLNGCGPAGFAIYFAVCQRGHRGMGYYLQWVPRDAVEIKHDLYDSVSAEAVAAVVDQCLDLGLFHAELYMQYGILTSREMQLRYVPVLARRTQKEVVAEWWLLSPEEGDPARPKPLMS